MKIAAREKPSGDSIQTLFVEFIARPESQAWVAAHAKREFPRLAVGTIFRDLASGELHAIAMPNSSLRPKTKWKIDPLAMIKTHRTIHERDGYIVGFFSTRAPGKPPTPEELDVGWKETSHWIISTNVIGNAVDGTGYFRDQYGKYEQLTSRFAINFNAQIFSEESRVVGSVVQVANVELMRWLKDHPNDLFRVHPGTFEQIVAEIFKDQGFDVEVLGSWNEADGGIDIIAIRKDTLAGPFRVGIQCKRYVKTRVVKADLVWALEGRLDKFHLNKGVLATTAHFEKSVFSDLKDHLWRIELRDFEMLKRDLQCWGQYEQGSTGLWLPK